MPFPIPTDFAYPLFFPKISMRISKKKRDHPFWKIIGLQHLYTYYYFFELTALQDGTSYVFLHIAREITKWLFQENEYLLQKNIKTLLELMEFSPYPFFDASLTFIIGHISYVLKELIKNQKYIDTINQLSSLALNTLVKQRVEESLGEEVSNLSSKDIRMSCVIALLCPLRQKIGSCFATAPAIRIQKQDIGGLLHDLETLLHQACMRKVIEGKEYVVPMSPSCGEAELHQMIDLRNHSFLEFSPGLIQALTKVGVLRKEDLYWNRARQLKKILDFLRAKFSFLNIQELLREILIDHWKKKHKGEVHGNGLTTIYQVAKQTFISLTQCSLLRSWEYTLASFADYKIDFYKWNLFTSLGLEYEKQEGIGQIIYTICQEKLQSLTKEYDLLEEERQRAIDHVNAAEKLLVQAYSYEALHRAKTELSTQDRHIHFLSLLQEEKKESATMYASLYSFFLEAYVKKFPEYFQEIYDPDLLAEEEDLFVDSPAGFRLVYKYGRSNPSLWTLIYTKEEFIEALTKFFLAIEPDVISTSPFPKGKKEMESLTTQILHHIRSESFFHFSLIRVQDIEPHGEKKKMRTPWSYIAGGTIHALLACYYKQSQDLQKEEKNIHTPEELCIFLIDLLKGLSLEGILSKNPKSSLLMYSPTHAFLLQPGLDFFRKGWEDRGFTYTWIRDFFVEPARQLYQSMLLNIRAQETIWHFFAKGEKLPILPISPSPLSPSNWREWILQRYSSFFSRKRIANFDSFLRKSLPLVDQSEMISLASQVIREIDPSFLTEARQFLQEFSSSYSFAYYPFYYFYSLVKAALFAASSYSSSSINIDHKLREALQKIAVFPPRVISFADSNWMLFLLAFVINPGTLKLELWSVDFCEIEGFPMYAWDNYWNQKEKNTWGVFTKPQEYS